jgi:hypothetical protein
MAPEPSNSIRLPSDHEEHTVKRRFKDTPPKIAKETVERADIGRIGNARFPEQDNVLEIAPDFQAAREKASRLVLTGT